MVFLRDTDFNLRNEAYYDYEFRRYYELPFKLDIRQCADNLRYKVQKHSMIMKVV